MYIFLRGYQLQCKRCLWWSSPVEELGQRVRCRQNGSRRLSPLRDLVLYHFSQLLQPSEGGGAGAFSRFHRAQDFQKSKNLFTAFFFKPGRAQPGPKVPDSRPLSLPKCDPTRLGPSPQVLATSHEGSLWRPAPWCCLVGSEVHSGL